MKVNISDFADLKKRMQGSFLTEALKLAKSQRYVEAAARLDDLTIGEDDKRAHAEALAFIYYRRALARQYDGKIMGAITDLERARSLPGLSDTLRQLIQARLTAIQSPKGDATLKSLDESISNYFEWTGGQGSLLQEFMLKHGLNKPQRLLRVPFVDGLASISVYRWKGDLHYGETWTQLIRRAKQGDQAVLAFFGRILAEHATATPACREWLREVDYVVPVPADSQRAAEREADIVGTMAEHTAQRLFLPIRRDIIKRATGAVRSREVGRNELASQYSIDPRKSAHVRGRTILLIDDVTTRGYTISVCAERLKDLGCAKIFVLTLAQAESSNKSELHFGESVSDEARRLAQWLCMADTDKLGPVRIKALLERFRSPETALAANDRDLRSVPDIGPKVAEALRAQAAKLDEYWIKASQLLNEAAKIGAKILTLDDPLYPCVLKASNASPAVLYVRSVDARVLAPHKMVAIVGSRQPTQDSIENTQRIAGALARAGWTVVSGMAEGVDGLAHAACLREHQPTIAFLGNGVDVTYPPSAKALRHDIIERGAVVSEYPFGTRTNENQLRRRNSLTVGQSAAVIIIQTKTDGGTMNAARAAKVLGKPLFCLEPPENSASQFSGNIELLKSGDARAINPQNAVALLTAALPA